MNRLMLAHTATRQAGQQAGRHQTACIALYAGDRPPPTTRVRYDAAALPIPTHDMLAHTAGRQAGR